MTSEDILSKSALKPGKEDMGTVHTLSHCVAEEQHRDTPELAPLLNPEDIRKQIPLSPNGFEVRHAIHGRLRAAFPHLKRGGDRQMIACLASCLSQVTGIRRVHYNSYCASITVEYDGDRMEKAAVVGIMRDLCTRTPASPTDDGDGRETAPYASAGGITATSRKHFRGSSILWIAGGTFFVGMSTLGVVVPGLPTPPFVLLSAYCYVRGSERRYRWLLNHPVFGKFIEETETGVRISRKAKRVTVYLLWVSIFISCFFFVHSMVTRTALVLMGVGVSAYMLRK